MDNVYKVFFEGLIDAEKQWTSADHLINVTFPVVKDPKLMLGALENLYNCSVKLISTILKFEYFFRRVELTSVPAQNLKIFFTKCARQYSLNENDVNSIKLIMELGKKHKQAGIEFTKSGKVIILSDDLSKEELRVDKVKEYITLLRRMLENTNASFRRNLEL